MTPPGHKPSEVPESVVESTANPMPGIEHAPPPLDLHDDSDLHQSAPTVDASDSFRPGSGRPDSGRPGSFSPPDTGPEQRPEERPGRGMEQGIVPANNPTRKGLSIGVKATALAAVFGVLPVLIVGNIAYRSANSSITERIAQQQLDQTDQLSGQLRQYMQERIANVKTVASIVNTFPILAEDLAPEDQAQIQRELTAKLTQFVTDYRTYASLGVFDLQGNVLAQSAGSAQEPNQAAAAYFQQVLQTNEPAVSEPIKIASQGDFQRFSVYVAAPVLGPAGNIEAVVAAQIPVDFIGNSILRAAVSTAASAVDTEFYRLVDSSGRIFQSLPLDQESSEIGVSITEQMPGFDSVQDQGQLLGWIGQTANGEALNVYAPVAGLGDLNWSVVTSNSTRAAFAPQRQLLQTILLGTVITAITAVLLGILLAKRATRPIEQVAEAVDQLGQGKLDARVMVKGNDELAFLGANVNRMAAQMQTLLQTLRQNAEQLGLQNDVLAGLARNDALIRGDAPGSARAFTAAIAYTLGVDRVSVWVYDRESEMITCLTQYQRSLEAYGTCPPLGTAQVPEYFQAMTANQLLAVESVSQEPMAQQLVEQNALAADTVSLLEMPIQIAGTFAGSLRCEHSGQRRAWKAEEQTFVSSVANLVALALESEFLQGEVSHLLDVVSAVEDGNLATQARVGDRTTGLVADTFNRLLERLGEVLHQAIVTSQRVAAGANQRNSQASFIAANAAQQADGVNQVLQLTDRVQSLALDASRQVETSQTSLQTLQATVDQGQGAMANLTLGIGILQEGSDRIIQQMKTLGEFVGLADQFVQDQTQIASLTQTLALNASLVAARAAEQRDPRQFAVAAREFSSIATQVSQLAQQTNTSLSTLEQRSAQIQSVVSTVDANVQRVGNLVEGFTRGVEQSNQAFQNVEAVTVEALNAEALVVEASQEIISAAESTTDVARTITNIAAQTAELTQNNRLQSEQMEALSSQLLATLAFFQLPAPAALPNGTGPLPD